MLFLLETMLAACTRGRRSGAHALRQGERGAEKRCEEAAPSRNYLQEETVLSCPSRCPRRCPSGCPGRPGLRAHVTTGRLRSRKSAPAGREACRHSMVAALP